MSPARKKSTQRTSSGAAAKKSGSKKSSARKPAGRKTAKKATKRTAARKTTKKTAGRKTTKKATKRPSARKSTKKSTRKSAKKATKKTAAKKSTSKKSTAHKPATKSTATKAPARKPAGKKLSRRPPTPKPHKFDRKTLNRIRGQLQEELAGLERQQAELEDSSLDATQSDMAGEMGIDEDFADAGTATFDRERDFSIRNNISDLIAQVTRALEKIDEGTYGNCEHCGRPINSARLQALPHALLCMDCKRRDERSR